MKIYTDIKISSMSGFGPAAWNREEHKMSMHPPFPDHVDLLEEEMLETHHHIVHRRHPENDCEEILIPREISIEELQPHHHHLLQHMLHPHHHSEVNQDNIPLRIRHPVQDMVRKRKENPVPIPEPILMKK